MVRRLKKLDHSMIYVLIAGSYTPILLRYMPSPRCYVFLGAVWLVALAGIAVKLLWICLLYTSGKDYNIRKGMR